MACVLLVDAPMAVAFALEPCGFQFLELSRQLGPYRVLGRIADGGMAAIFRGLDVRTGEIVALKTLRTDRPCHIEGIDRESAILRRLRHDGVVRLRGEGSSDGFPWLALEFLEGHTLFDEISRIWKRVPRDTGSAGGASTPAPVASEARPQESATTRWARDLDADPAFAPPRRRLGHRRLEHALALAGRLLPVLGYIHDRGVVHRDVKPENVMVGPDGQLTLLDFGLAFCPRRRGKVESKRWSIGTVEYAAPEQMVGETVDARADLYSFGCILYELVTGHRLFDGSSPTDIARKHVEWQPVPPSDVVAGVPWRLEDLILALLAKNPAARPRGAGAVAAQLKQMAA